MQDRVQVSLSCRLCKELKIYLGDNGHNPLKHLSWGTKYSNLSYSKHSKCPVKKRAQDELERYRVGKNIAKELLPDGSRFKGGGA